MAIIRVGIIAVQHESNTFLSGTTRWNDFLADTLTEGSAVRSRFDKAHHEIGGFFEGIDRSGAEAVGLFAARATPGGTIEAAAASRLMQQVERAGEQARGLDGLLVAPHGAAVSEAEPDFDGRWLTRLREIVGSNMPIVCTLDLHANVSHQMIRACQATVAYHTNPHVDQRARGIEAARLLVSSLQRAEPLTQCAALFPMAVGIERQNTAESPCRELFARASKLEQQGRTLSVSPVLGFPYADVPEMGSSLIVVTRNDRRAAAARCRELSHWWWDERDRFVSQGASVAEAIDRASRREGPVGLLDMGDNVGGGSPGDGTLIAHEVATRGGPPTLVCLWDREIASRAAADGVGTRITQWRIGGKHDRLHGTPLPVNGVIAAVTDGRFRESAVRHGGKTEYDMGTTAVIETDSGLTLVVHSNRTPPFSAGQILSVGIEPQRFQLIVLKGVQAPIAAYESICRSFERVNTPGVTTADLGQLAYGCRRKPLFPLERAAAWSETVWVEGA